ncbi:MAG: FemAB family PEP-CTERM system-associated protein [Planctomycetes bacterium]|nr:FemAB family PEP-CTERM system-associated protein [Planctomycetota bacterium]
MTTPTFVRPKYAPVDRAAPPVVETLSAADHAAWDRFVRLADGGTFFHRIAWMEAVHETFGHKAIYLLARRGGRIVGGLPLFHVQSLLGGTMLVSIPYAVYGGVLGNDSKATTILLQHVSRLAEEMGARCVELRSEQAVWPHVPVIDRYAGFRRRLPDDPGDVLGWLPRKARAAARAARDKHKLEVSFDDQHLATVWRLYCRSMHRLGSLNYPLKFFEELVHRSPGDHLVSLIRHQGKPVAGLVTFLFNGVAMPYFVGADERFLHLNINNFVYLTAMERAVELGCHTFDFGRSRADNEGACAFKRHHGFTAKVLGYQVYTPPGERLLNLTPSNPKFALACRIWPLLPTPVARTLGAWLSKHIPG